MRVALASTFPSPTVIILALATTFTLATSTTTSTSSTRHGEIRGIVFSLAIIVLGVVRHSIARAASLEFRAFLDMGKDILAAIVWGDKSKALVLEKLLPGANQASPNTGVPEKSIFMNP